MGNQSKLVGWKRVLAIGLVLLIVPLMPEIILFLDIIGLEATLLFLFVYSQSVLQEFSNRASYAYYYVEASISASASAVSAKRNYPQKTGFALSLTVSASLATLFLTGSLAFAICAWGPLFVSASQMVV